MKVRGFGVALVFLVGCAVGGVSSQAVVPKASAQQAQLTRWEYTCRVPYEANEKVSQLANRFGAEGWELITVRSVGREPELDVLCFKRPKM
jgi:hypothetical protein